MLTLYPTTSWGQQQVFKSTAVDLFGPLLFQDPYNKRTGKAWGGCLCLHSDFSGAHGDNRVLLHGLVPDCPREVHDDPGGAKEVPVRLG